MECPSSEGWVGGRGGTVPPALLLVQALPNQISSGYPLGEQVKSAIWKPWAAKMF